jgi:hypothetical protein
MTHSDDLEAGLLPAADSDEGRAVLRVVEVTRHPVHGHLSRPANHHTNEIKPVMSGANDLVWQTVCYFTAS